MRVTIIADDNYVYVDGQPCVVDLTGLDPDIHAVQWYDTMGEIEYRYHFAKHAKRPNERFDDFAPFQVFVDRYVAAQKADIKG